MDTGEKVHLNRTKPKIQGTSLFPYQYLLFCGLLVCRSIHATDWLEANKLLFEYMTQLFKKRFPNMWWKYEDIVSKLPERLTGAWSTAVVNIKFASARHIDVADYWNGLCWVIPFGTYWFHFSQICTIHFFFKATILEEIYT